MANEKSFGSLIRLQRDESPDVENRLEFFEKLKTDPTFHIQVKNKRNRTMEATFER